MIASSAMIDVALEAVAPDLPEIMAMLAILAIPA
jgi:hypothetical protein